MAGVAPPESQLIKHFGAKEGLLEAIFAQGWDNLRYVFRAVQEVPAPADKLKVLLELLVAGLHRDPELEELLLLEGRRIRKEGHLVMMSAGYLETGALRR